MDVKAVAGRGRGLVAARDLRAGEVVLRESPLLVYAEAESAATGLFCWRCARSVDTSRCSRCAGCSRATFCTAECRLIAERSGHAPWLCSTLVELAGLRLHPEVETQGRFLLAAADLTLRNPSAFQQLLALDGGDSSSVADEAGIVGVVQNLLKRTGMEPLKCLTAEMMVSLLGKDKKNAFGLMAPTCEDGQRKVRAYALYSTASMLNHDCLPNACRFEYLDKAGGCNTDIYVRLLHDVAKGTEICISYFPLNWNYLERQRRLREEYGFLCQCERCGVEEKWNDGEAMEQDGSEEEEEEDNEDNGGEGGVEDDDFPHAMFFVKYLCPWEGCGGTMAPLPADASVMECNVCGRGRSEQEFLEDLQPKS